jgi:alpha-glucuronidase
MDEPYWIKINWPQIATGEGADRPVELYHVICWDAMIDTEGLLPKKLFPKMVENESGDFEKIGLMARQWLKYSGNVFPDRMSKILERLKCRRELWHVADKTCSLSAILLMGDTYV